MRIGCGARALAVLDGQHDSIAIHLQSGATFPHFRGQQGGGDSKQIRGRAVASRLGQG